MNRIGHEIIFSILNILENGGGEYIYVSREQRAMVGEQKIDYLVVTFVEKEPL